MTYPEARLVRLPLSVPGMASVDENGEPMIYLNDRLTLAQHLRTYAHELEHIARDDFFNDLPIEAVEGQPQKPVQRQPRKRKERKAPQSPQEHLHQLFHTVREILPEDLRPDLDDLFSRRPANTDEIRLRGWLLYGLPGNSPYWTQILLTYALYPYDMMPHRQDRDAARATRRTIPYEAMKRIMYALCGTIVTKEAPCASEPSP